MRTQTQPAPAFWPTLFSDRLRLAALVLSLVGAANAAYLSWSEVFDQSVVCLSGGGCDVVRTSIYSELYGVPVAVLGLGAYLISLALLAAEPRLEPAAEYAPLAVFGLSLVGVLFSLYLQYVSLAILNAVCNYCVVNAVTMSLLLAVASVRLWRRFSADE